ncbi:MAG: DedA family protein [Nanoarchaeota archaeon]
MGYLGIFFGMMIESTIFPLPSELILIPAGALVARGEMSFSLVFLIAIAGTILGALINFLFAMFLGRGLVNMLVKKYGRFLFITERRLNKADSFFNEHGEITVFIGRLIPIARHIISIPAGFSRMNMLRFVIYTALGAAVWSAFLIYIGYVFWDRLEWINEQLSVLYIPILIFVLVILVLYILVRKNKTGKKNKK